MALLRLPSGIAVNVFTRYLRGFYYGAGHKIDPDERTCLRLLNESVPDTIVSAVQAQVLAIQLIKRESKGKLSQFMLNDSDLPKVPNLREVFAFSILKDGNRADIIFSEGVLTAIEFNPRPFPDDRRGDGQILCLCDLANLGRPSPSDGAAGTIGNLLGRAAQNPLPPAELRFREAYFKRVFCRLPEEYAELVSVSDSFDCEHFYFEGTQSQTIPWPEKTLQVLAVHRTRPLMLCMEDALGSEEILILNHEEHSLSSTGRSFLEALTQFEKHPADGRPGSDRQLREF